MKGTTAQHMISPPLPPTVLLCTPCLRIGGTELQTLALADALAGDGWRVMVLVYFDEVDGVVRHDFEQAGVAIKELGLRRSISLPRLLLRLVRVFRDVPVDIVHIQYMAPGFTPVMAARLAGCRRIVATVHQTASAYGWKARILLRSAAARSDVFLCNSLATEQSWFGQSSLYTAGEGRLPRGHCTVYNGVDVTQIANAAASADRGALAARLGFDRSPVVGVVGRLRGEKGQETAIRALPSLLRWHPSAGLLIVGDGPDRDRLQRLCRDLGVEASVRFLGAVPQAQAHASYGFMQALAMPSCHEGFGLVAAEAMAANVPVVASDIPTLAEVLAGGEAGILTPPGDSEALAAGLHRILSDTDLRSRICQAASARVAGLFSRQVFDRNAVSIHRALIQ